MQFETRKLVDEAIVRVDELRGSPMGSGDAAGRALDGVRRLLVRLEAEVDAKGPAVGVAIELDRAIEELKALVRATAPELRERLSDLVGSVRKVVGSVVPSVRRVRGAFPMLTQESHGAIDYAGGLVAFGSAIAATQPGARAVGLSLGGSMLVASALTDYRLGLVKVAPITAHRIFDFLWGATAVTLPLALRYTKKQPIASGLQIAAGAACILSALFTDHRVVKARKTSRILDPREQAECEPTGGAGGLQAA